MKHSTRDMNQTELDEFLKMTPRQIYDEVSKFRPGQVQQMVLLTLLNLLVISATFTPIVEHLAHDTPLTWWMWMALLFMLISFGWMHNSFPNPEKARRLCEEQEELLEQRKRRRL